MLTKVFVMPLIISMYTSLIRINKIFNSCCFFRNPFVCVFPNNVKEKHDYITWNDQICNENVKDIINLNAYYLQNFFSKYMYIYIYIYM